MALNASGPIGAGGAAGVSINLELGQPETQTLAINDYDTRALANTYGTGTTVSFSNFYGKTKPTYSFSAVSLTSVNEGSPVTFSVATTNVPTGTVLYWSTLPGATAVTGPDFSDGLLTGSVTIGAGGTASIVRTLAADALSDNNETFQLELRVQSAAGPIKATSTTITVISPTYAISTPAAINEGSTATFTVTTTGVNDGTTLYYSTGGTATAADFSDATLSGSFTVTGGTGTISRTAAADALTEGNETFTISVRTGSTGGTVQATSGSVTINDTSLSPASQILHAGSSSTLNGSDSGSQLAWTVPAGVTSISVLCIAGGGGGAYVNASTNGGGSAGGGGGGLAYTNNISVTPGETITLRAGNGGGSGANGIVRAPSGGNSQIYRPATPTTYLVRAYGGAGGIRTTTASTTIVGGAGGSYGVGQAGFTGGQGGGGLNGNNSISATVTHGGGGGAAGYTGIGGTGGGYNGNYVTATAGSGGGGGGGGYKTSTGNTVSAPSTTNNFPGQGGGVGPFGIGTSGSAGTDSGSGVAGNATPGGNGSGNYNYGSGGAAISTPSGSSNGSPGGAGCIRIIWPGNVRQFPNTRTADE